MNQIISGKICRHSRLVAFFFLFSTIILSSCSSKQDSQSSTPANNTSPSAQSSAPVNSNPTPSGAAGAQSTPSAPAAAAVPMPSHEHLAGIGSATVITIHGKIVSVDRTKKFVTLAGPGGKNVTLHVRNSYNLQAAEPGDPFVAKFYEIVTVRTEKSGESIPPISLAQGIVSAEPGQTPGAAVGHSVQVVATIVAINKHKKTVDLEGPDGALETVNVANPSNLKHAHVGDEIVITLTRVMAIFLAKETGA